VYFFASCLVHAYCLLSIVCWTCVPTTCSQDLEILGRKTASCVPPPIPFHSSHSFLVGAVSRVRQSPSQSQPKRRASKGARCGGALGSSLFASSSPRSVNRTLVRNR
jgi:hypothetical protein